MTVFFFFSEIRVNQISEWMEKQEQVCVSGNLLSFFILCLWRMGLAGREAMQNYCGAIIVGSPLALCQILAGHSVPNWDWSSISPLKIQWNPSKLHLKSVVVKCITDWMLDLRWNVPNLASIQGNSRKFNISLKGWWG